MRSDRTEPRSERQIEADAVRRLHRGAGPAPEETGRYAEPRSWLSRTGDEIASWFGDTAAMRRRQWDEASGDHTGEGPTRVIDADTRIADDLVRRLTADSAIDASRIQVEVLDRVVTLDGAVATIAGARRAEDMALSVAGVTRVRNNLTVE